MECAGWLFAVVVGVIIYVVSRIQPEARNKQPSDSSSGSALNGLFALFLFDRWMEHGADGLLGGPNEPQPDRYDQEENQWDDSDVEDGYWDDQAGF
jgi:hypothetical protein